MFPGVSIRAAVCKPREVVDVEGKMVYYSFKELMVSLGLVTKLLSAKEARRALRSSLDEET